MEQLKARAVAAINADIKDVEREPESVFKRAYALGAIGTAYRSGLISGAESGCFTVRIEDLLERAGI